MQGTFSPLNLKKQLNSAESDSRSGIFRFVLFITLISASRLSTPLMNDGGWDGRFTLHGFYWRLFLSGLQKSFFLFFFQTWMSTTCIVKRITCRLTPALTKARGKNTVKAVSIQTGTRQRICLRAVCLYAAPLPICHMTVVLRERVRRSDVPSSCRSSRRCHPPLPRQHPNQWRIVAVLAQMQAQGKLLHGSNIDQVPFSSRIRRSGGVAVLWVGNAIILGVLVLSFTCFWLVKWTIIKGRPSKAERFNAEVLQCVGSVLVNA